jgi:hypothetical protein
MSIRLTGLCCTSILVSSAECTYFRSTSMLISTIQPVTLNALGGVPKMIFKACDGRPIFQNIPITHSEKSPKCGPETHPKSKMLERAYSHHRAPSPRPTLRCTMLCNKRQKNTKFCMNGAWQIMAAGTARLTQIDRRMRDLHIAVRFVKVGSLHQQADRLQLTAPL